MFKTLDDFMKVEKKEGDKKEKSNNNPNTKNDKKKQAESSDDVHGLLRKAEDNSKKIKAGKQKPEPDCKITIYKNGFTIDDGEYRDYDSPANKKFISELYKGYVPQELRTIYPKGVNIGLEDRRDEEYGQQAVPRYTAFSREGRSLSSDNPVPTVRTTVVESNVKAGPLKTKPKTRVLIRLHDGKTEELEINLDTKVLEVFTYVSTLSSQTGAFELIAGFPPKPIKNLDLTIEEAGLEDSKVIQKLL